MTLNKNQSIAIHTGIIVLPLTIATSVLSYHFFHLPTLATCMTTSFILTPITLLMLHHFEKHEQPCIVFDGDDVRWGEHQWRRSDVDVLVNGLIAFGAMGITVFEERTVIDAETPMAMYPEMVEEYQ